MWRSASNVTTNVTCQSCARTYEQCVLNSAPKAWKSCNEDLKDCLTGGCSWGRSKREASCYDCATDYNQCAEGADTFEEWNECSEDYMSCSNDCFLSAGSRAVKKFLLNKH